VDVTKLYFGATVYVGIFQIRSRRASHRFKPRRDALCQGLGNVERPERTDVETKRAGEPARLSALQMTTAVGDLDESIVGNLVLLIGLPCRRRACSQPDQALDLEHRPVLEVWAVRLSGAVRQQGPLTGPAAGRGSRLKRCRWGGRDG
jgi:hypothetical protein